jgi:hypothetical protein
VAGEIKIRQVENNKLNLKTRGARVIKFEFNYSQITGIEILLGRLNH